MFLDSIFLGPPLREKIAFLLLPVLLLIILLFSARILINRRNRNEARYWLIANAGLSILIYLLGEAFASLSLAIYHRQISTIILDGIQSWDLAHFEHAEEQIAAIIHTAYSMTAALGILTTLLLWLLCGKAVVREADESS
ncbi:MAG: hypothetical protein SF339_16500 [Blastocatellia bacterium]|nr:hypothetical protein [Blastocatellia bacterium]